MIEPAVLHAMLSSGATAEMIVAAVEADYGVELEKRAVKRAQDAKRQSHKRHADKADVTAVTRTGRDSRAVDGREIGKEAPHTPQENILNKPPPNPPRKANRGTRLPQDWHPNENLWSWAKTELGFADAELKLETSAFRDHFWSAPGSKGTKLNWERTWKNWMREGFRRRKRFEPKSAQSTARTTPTWSAVQYDYKQKYGADAFKRYTEDTANQG